MNQLFKGCFQHNNKLGFQLCINPLFQLCNISRFQFSCYHSKSQFCSSSMFNYHQVDDTQKLRLQVLAKIQEQQQQQLTKMQEQSEQQFTYSPNQYDKISNQLLFEIPGKLVTNSGKIIKRLDKLNELNEKINSVKSYTSPLSVQGISLGKRSEFFGFTNQLYLGDKIQQISHNNKDISAEIYKQNSLLYQQQDLLKTHNRNLYRFDASERLLQNNDKVKCFCTDSQILNKLREDNQ